MRLHFLFGLILANCSGENARTLSIPAAGPSTGKILGVEEKTKDCENTTSKLPDGSGGTPATISFDGLWSGACEGLEGSDGFTSGRRSVIVQGGKWILVEEKYSPTMFGGDGRNCEQERLSNKTEITASSVLNLSLRTSANAYFIDLNPEKVTVSNGTSFSADSCNGDQLCEAKFNSIYTTVKVDGNRLYLGNFRAGSKFQRRSTELDPIYFVKSQTGSTTASLNLLSDSTLRTGIYSTSEYNGNFYRDFRQKTCFEIRVAIDRALDAPIALAQNQNVDDFGSFFIDNECTKVFSEGASTVIPTGATGFVFYYSPKYAGRSIIDLRTKEGKALGALSINVVNSAKFNFQRADNQGGCFNRYGVLMCSGSDYEFKFLFTLPDRRGFRIYNPFNAVMRTRDWKGCDLSIQPGQTECKGSFFFVGSTQGSSGERLQSYLSYDDGATWSGYIEGPYVIP